MPKKYQFGITLAVGTALLISLAYLTNTITHVQNYAGVAVLESANADRPVTRSWKPISEDELPFATIPWTQRPAVPSAYVDEAKVPTFPTLRDPANPEPVRLFPARVPVLK